jgi:hypothetical protein
MSIALRLAAASAAIAAVAATRTARHTARAQLEEAQAFDASCAATTSTG